MEDDDFVRETYPLVLKAIDKDDEDPEQYLEYLDDGNEEKAEEGKTEH